MICVGTTTQEFKYSVATNILPSWIKPKTTLRQLYDRFDELEILGVSKKREAEKLESML